MAERRRPRFSHSEHLRGDNRSELTARQIEVIELLCQGLRYKEIAAELGISAETVRNHVQLIYLKLDVHTAIQAVLAWRERKEQKEQN